MKLVFRKINKKMVYHRYDLIFVVYIHRLVLSVIFNKIFCQSIIKSHAKCSADLSQFYFVMRYKLIKRIILCTFLELKNNIADIQ